MVAQGYTQEEGINYDEVFAPVGRIEAIRLFLAHASFKDFVVYQMDVKSAFIYSKIEEEVYVCQPSGFEDPEFSDKVYKAEKALYGLHQAPKAWYGTLSTYLLDNGFQRGTIDKTLFIKKIKGLQVTQKDDGIFISQDKYMDEILKKFGFSTVKTASTPMETSKLLLNDAEAEDVDVHLYRSMIRSLIESLDTRKVNLNWVLWYPKDSPFDFEAYTDSDYAGASLDRKSTTGAKNVAASSCCGQVLWIQNQMLDYGYNFMNTKIFIDNESTICIVKNPVFHSKTKHIEIRHHFIRDSYEKRLIQVIKIYTYHNVADLLTKAFDVSRFQYLIASIGILNL
ncbi:putative ribonuclease H-like domain-containing protein [Tanacetum coccineum]